MKSILSETNLQLTTDIVIPENTIKTNLKYKKIFVIHITISLCFNYIRLYKKIIVFSFCYYLKYLSTNCHLGISFGENRLLLGFPLHKDISSHHHQTHLHRELCVTGQVVTQRAAAQSCAFQGKNPLIGGYLPRKFASICVIRG